MITASIVPKEINTMAKIDEFKSVDGVRFKAKLMGNTIVEEIRGKTVAEYAMAKLKLNIMKQKQHKTRVNISLKWDGFCVYLSDGGQELLHSFPLENISFVWKDPCDDRALGIICNDGVNDKQLIVSRFYGYKTEKLALPLIMALKELFGLRTNEHNDTSVEKNESENAENIKEETPSSSEDLLDLKVEISKPLEINYALSSSTTADSSSNWTSFSNVNLYSTFPPAQSFPPCVTNVNTIPSMWQPYPINDNTHSNQPWSTMNQQSVHQYSNPFSQPILYPASNNFNVNIQNPFGIVTTNPIPIPSATILQPQPIKNVPPKISRNHVDDLFSDLLTNDYGLDPSSIVRQSSKSSLSSNSKDSGKISLIEMKQRQEIKDKIDFSSFEKSPVNPSLTVNAPKVDYNPMSIPLFQFD